MHWDLHNTVTTNNKGAHGYGVKLDRVITGLEKLKFSEL